MLRIKQLIEAIVALTKVLRLKQPGNVYPRLVYEGEKMSKFVLVLPTPSAADVVERIVEFNVNSGPQTDQVLTGDATVSLEFEANEGDTVVGQLIDVDDAANQSAPSQFSFALTDNLAPPEPGQVGFQMTEEDQPL